MAGARSTRVDLSKVGVVPEPVRGDKAVACRGCSSTSEDWPQRWRSTGNQSVAAEVVGNGRPVAVKAVLVVWHGRASRRKVAGL
jgi:hypothetical protein